MERFNVFGADYTYAGDRPAGYRCGSVRLGPLVGASRIAGTIYELPSGESTWPYHYEYGSGEGLLGLDGRPPLPHPQGGGELEPGGLLCFPGGPRGAPKPTNPRGPPPPRMIGGPVHRP